MDHPLKIKLLAIAAGNPFVVYCKRCEWGRGLQDSVEAEHIFELHQFGCPKRKR